MTLEERSFDVVIVGGRPAGASLAARLGAAGLSVLVVDKARFPSRPAVSAPFVLPHTMVMIVAQGRADRWAELAETSSPEEIYDRLLRARPLVSGMKRIPNLFRTPRHRRSPRRCCAGS